MASRTQSSRSKTASGHPRSGVIAQLVAIVVVCLLFGVALVNCETSPEREAVVQLRDGRGGAVNGSVHVQPTKGTAGDDVFVDAGDPIPLPDFEVFLERQGSGDLSGPVTTDLFGRYMFPKQKPGRYRLIWKEQNGWAAGQHPDLLVIRDHTKYPTPASVRPRRPGGVLTGRVEFLDDSSPWTSNEFFEVDRTARVVVRDAGGTDLHKPVRANWNGGFAIAGLPTPPQRWTVRTTVDSLTRDMAAPVAAITNGMVGSPISIELRNHRPEIFKIFVTQGGKPVRSPAVNSTVELSLSARDVDGDSLTFEWGTLEGMGTITPAGGDTAMWKMPARPGRYRAYVTATDKRGGYAREAVTVRVGYDYEIFSGRVVNADTNAPVANAEIEINGATATSNANGGYFVQVPMTDRFVVNVDKPGFALQSKPYHRGVTGQIWRLVPAQTTQVDPTQPIVLVDDRDTLRRRKMRGVEIRIPANALVDENGNPPAGMLTADVATLDIGDGQAPGDWGAQSGGRETNLVSYGAAYVEFRDAAGKEFNLRPGVNAEVRMAPPNSLVAGAQANAPLWSYNEKNGFWEKSGDATFDQNSSRYIGKVSHFSTINTDLEKDEAACLKVVLDETVPTGLTLRITDPTGAAFAQTFEFVMNDEVNAVYRLPANTNVKLEVLNPDGQVIVDIVAEEIPGTPLPGNLVNSGGPIPPGETLWPDPNSPEIDTLCKTITLRLQVPDWSGFPGSPFFTFKGNGSEANALDYYEAVDPNDDRLTLGDWWDHNGFDPTDGSNANAHRTSYLNFNDLGSGRDMYLLDQGNGNVAAYVTNYGEFNQDHGNADLAATKTEPGATVCMEFSPVEGQDPNRKIVKFFVYAGNGNGAAAVRQTGAELDGFGVKYVPNLCLNCHGGNYFPSDPANPSLDDVDMLAAFRELDTATYLYPGGATTPSAAAETSFHAQNDVVVISHQGDPAIHPIEDLIAGWYISGGDSQDNTFTPSAWSTQSGLYANVVARSCRTCHIAFDSDNDSSGNSFHRYDQFQTRRASIQAFVCGNNKLMPHAVTTYRNFWLDLDPSHAPTFLANFSAIDWPTLGSCE
ncbi:MAG: hypothetical protein ACF8PN_08250 [Phycisphaerales bacterium]